MSELVITRIFNAPREKVWKAWTDIEHMKKWWGPKNFSAPVIKMNLKEGGKYLFCMLSPEGQKFWSTGILKEISPMDRLVWTDSFSDENGNVVSAAEYGMDKDFPKELLVTITFEDEGNKTKMTLVHAGMPEGVMSDMTKAGWDESFEKLAESLK